MAQRICTIATMLEVAILTMSKNTVIQPTCRATMQALVARGASKAIPLAIQLS